MIKFLIYNSKEIFNKADDKEKSDAHVIAYEEGDGYQIMKDLTGNIGLKYIRGKATTSYQIQMAEQLNLVIRLKSKYQ